MKKKNIPLQQIIFTIKKSLAKKKKKKNIVQISSQ